MADGGPDAGTKKGAELKTLQKILFFSFLAILAGSQWACEKDETTPAFILAAKNPAIPANLFALVNTYACASCHYPGGPYGFQDLTTAQNCYQSWVGASAAILTCPGTRVIKNDAANSVLIKRLEGTCLQMPYGGPYLTVSEIQQFKDWINQGALPQ